MFELYARSADMPDSSKERTVTFVLQCFYSLVRQRSSRPLEVLEAGVQIYKGELQI